MKAATIDLGEVLDRSGLGRLQWTVLLLCAACLLVDGFDIQAIGFVAPEIAKEWGVKPGALGVVLSSGLVGMLLGSTLFTLMADKFGRRPMLIAAVMLAGIGMLITSQAQSVGQLMAMRFATGIALGSLMPNAISLTSEYCPTRGRTTIVMIMATGLTLGAALGGWLTSMVIGSWGWRGVFAFGGAVPLALGLLMLFTLPESLRWMALRGAAKARIDRTLRALRPGLDPETDYEVTVAESKDAKVSPLELFREGRGPTTLLLWLVGFMALLDLFFLSSWLPTVIRGAGYPLATAVRVSTMLQAGGVIGALIMAVTIARVPLRRLIAAGYLVAFVSILLVGQAVGTLPALFVAVTICGFCIIGGQPGLNAWTAEYYPTVIRSTGVGWMLGIGRLGSILGPIVGGVLLEAKLANGVLFVFAAVPALIAALGLTLIGRLKS